MKPDENVVARLKRQLQRARSMGFQVRMEVLEDQQPGWCQIGNSKLLFVDLSQTAAEQLAQLEELLQSASADQQQAA